MLACPHHAQPFEELVLHMRSSFVFRLVVVVSLSALTVLVVAQEDDPASASPAMSSEELAEFVLDGMWAKRGLARSGKVAIRVTTRFPSANQKEGEGEARVSTHTFQVSFDRDARKLRCDHRQQPGERLTHYAETPDGSVFHVVGSHTVTKEPPGEEVVIQDVRPVEVRLVGLVTLSDFTLPATMKEYRGSFGKVELSEAKEVEAGMYRLSYDVLGRDPPITSTLWIDAAKGFAPVRAETALSRGDTKYVLTAIRTEWSNKSGVWVPVTSTISEPPAGINGTISLDWSAVNLPIPDIAFTEDDFGLSDGATVWNNRLGQPVLERVIGTQKKSLDTQSALDAATGADRPTMRMRTLLILSSGALLLVLLSIWIWRHKRAELDG